MSANVEDNRQIDAERALGDAIDIVFKYLGPGDLRTVSKVSKSWREAALREINNRCYIRHLHLSDKFNLWQRWTSWESEYAKWDPELENRNITPHTSLLIYDHRLLYRVINMGDGRYKKMENYFRDQLPYNLIMLGIEEYLTTEDVDLEDADNQLNQCKMRDSVILGLLIPSRKGRAHVRTTYVRKSGSTAGHLIESLGLLSSDNERPKCIILLFALEQTGFYLVQQVVKTLRHRFKERKDTIWGAYFGHGLLRATSDTIYCKSGEKSVVALRIEGPKVDAWTTIIRCHWSSDEIEQKLCELKEKVTGGRHRSGLVCGPCGERVPFGKPCKNSNQQIIMRILKKIFPSIPFVGLFGHGCRSWTTEGDTDSMEEDFMSIIIISYD